jgi:hypothetical protein
MFLGDNNASTFRVRQSKEMSDSEYGETMLLRRSINVYQQLKKPTV